MLQGRLRISYGSSFFHLEDLTFFKEQIKATPDVPNSKKEKETPVKAKAVSFASKKTILRIQPFGDKCSECNANHYVIFISSV